MRFFVICFLAVCLLTSGGATHAQKKTDPRVVILHPGATALKKDIGILFSLLTPAEQKQKQNMIDFVNQFLAGVNEKEFVRVNLLFGNKGVRYVVNFPVSNLVSFRENIDLFGLKSKKRGATYQLSGEFDGWMSYKNKYTTIVKAAGDFAAIPNARLGVEGLVARKESITFALVNDSQGPADLVARRDSFGATRRELLAVMKKKPTERASAFEVRKLGLENQLDELERFFVESARFVTGWQYNPTTGGGSLSFELEGIKDTDLAKTIAEFGNEPCHFAGITRNPKSILSGRFMHPIDAMRRKALASFFDKAVVSLSERIATSDRITGAAEKAAATEFAKIAIKMAKTGAAGGSFDGFIEVIPVAGGNQFVGGVKTPEDMTADAMAAIKAWTASRTGQSMKTDVDAEGDVKIHSVNLSFKNTDIQQFVGSPTLYLGVGPESLWYAAGPDALPLLKASIQSAGGDAPAGPLKAIDITGHINPWLTLLDRIRSRQPIPSTREAQTRRKELDNMRAAVLAATAGGDDVLSFEVLRNGEKINGKLTVVRGILRFIGKEVARFTKENLDIN